MARVARVQAVHDILHTEDLGLTLTLTLTKSNPFPHLRILLQWTITKTSWMQRRSQHYL